MWAQMLIEIAVKTEPVRIVKSPRTAVQHTTKGRYVIS